MGKRNKETNVGRRRPMIQLGSSQKQGLAAVSRRTHNEPLATPSKKNEGKPETEINEMDDQLAGFLAEINSLETPDTQVEKEATLSAATTTTAQPTDTSNMLYDPDTFDPSTQGHLLPENWQACYDDRTMCYYYWNMVTNEVQWYPPVATIPPPPPSPPPSPPEIEETSNQKAGDTAVEDIVVIGAPEPANGVEKTSEDINKKEKSSEAENGSDEENPSSSKTKDKELMSQIKERIRKKKEEKLKKGIEEKQRQDEEDLEKKQQEKEETLRERLIRKKLEREKSVDNNTLTNEESATTALDASREEPFVVDIFAIETNKANKMNAKELVSPEGEGKLDTVVVEEVKKEDTVKGNSGKEAVVTMEPSVESKGGWRIIDAMYDDDDDDDNESGGEEEDGRETDVNSKKENKALMKESDTEEVGKKGEEMDDYAEMLLEDAIGKDDSTESNINDSTVNPTPPAAPPPSAPPLPEKDDRPPLPPEDEPLPSMEQISIAEDENNRKLVGSLSTELFEKLDFLGINKKELRNLQIYFIELETRMRDWQSGALNTKYFLEKVNDLNVEIQKYEETAAPPGWMCHWNSDYRMYYYHNIATGNSQWDYPTDISQQAQQQQQQQQHATIIQAPTAAPIVVSHATNAVFPVSQVVVMPPHIMPMMSMAAAGYIHATSGMMIAAPSMSEPTTTTLSAAATALVSPAHGFSRNPIPSESSKRKATDSDASDPYRDPYRMVKKKKEIVGFPDQVENQDNQGTSETESGTSSPMPKSVIAAAPVIRDVSREASPSLNGTSDDYLSSFSPTPTGKPENPGQAILKGKVKKKKKLDASGLPSKKKKQVSSLVQKWQTVKQKVEEEENVDDEYEEDTDHNLMSEKRIEEWKKEMETSGKKDYNPNFQEIKGDWRERLKLRKSTT